MCVYACMHITMYLCTYVPICMYVCTYVRMYVCTYVRMYVCTYMYVRMYLYVCTYVPICMYVCTYMYVRMYLYVCTYVRMYLHGIMVGKTCVRHVYAMCTPCRPCPTCVRLPPRRRSVLTFWHLEHLWKDVRMVVSRRTKNNIDGRHRTSDWIT